jgi:hypothetical protein
MTHQFVVEQELKGKSGEGEVDKVDANQCK